MTHNLDSRALGVADTYGQRFMREGTYEYGVVTAGCGVGAETHPYRVRVSEGKGDMEQHTVMLEAEKGKLRPSDPELKIKTGDLVTWACRDWSVPAFEIVGGKDFFGSARLYNESGYAHAFGTAGVFEWVDAYGSGLGGTVTVTDPECSSREELTAWRRSLEEGQLVMITGDEADPADVEVATGQTVYFAVTKSPGISITDPVLARTVPSPGFPPSDVDSQGAQAPPKA